MSLKTVKSWIIDLAFHWGVTRGHLVSNPIVYVVTKSGISSTSFGRLYFLGQVKLIAHMENWLTENCKGKYKPVFNNEFVIIHNIAFSRKSDAVLFTLTFTKDEHPHLYWFNYETATKYLTSRK